MKVNEIIKKLRELMKENNIDAYIVPTSDPHQSEYVADYYKSRVFLTGFTGSAGTALVTMDKAYLWADGRYFIQAEKQIEDSEFELMKMATPGYPSLTEWLSENLKENDVIGFDGKVMSQKLVEEIDLKLKNKKISFNGESDLVGKIWETRPELPKTKVFLLGEEYAGYSANEKLDQVREKMKEIKADYFVISGLDDIAWLYNIRGRDVENNPVTISYALVSMDKAYLFIDEEKLSEDIVENLNNHGVEILEYLDIKKKLSEISSGSVIVLDKSRVNSWLYNGIDSKVKIINQIDITSMLKAIKNDIEIKNQRQAYIKDGVCLTKLFCWMDKNVKNGNITELDVERKLEEIRKDLHDDYIEPSFGSIAAYGSNAAMMHYSATEDSFATLDTKGMFLLDAGGQYMCGTTDTTRTVALGDITDEERDDFTYTLMSHINLISSRFLEGTTGRQLDAICRYPLWQIGSDYKCGTGHGVGFLLNVHEGPQSLSPRCTGVELEPGMVVTVEPGVYKFGKHGIRIENVGVVKEDIKTDSGQFLSFETLSFVPIDLNCINKDLLSQRDKDWLNNYHKEVYNKLSSYMTEEEDKWLQEKTREI